MATVKELLADAFATIAFKKTTVATLVDLSPHFRLVELAGDDLRGASCKPGDKIQVLVDGGDLRTYSPFAFDGGAGRMRLAVYSHGDAPGTRWARKLSVGAGVRFFGPRGSLPLGALAGPVVFFGDETSFGAARALVDARHGGEQVELVFEVGSIPAVTPVLEALALSPVLIERNSAHLADVEARLRDALARHLSATLVLTGKAQSIQSVRAALKARPPATAVPHKVRAYWSVGKTGLD